MKLYLEQVQSDVWVASGDDEMAEGIEFQPVYAFRNPISNAIVVEVPDEIHKSNQVHVVIAYWFERFGEEDENPVYHWHLCGATQTRRQAVEVKNNVEMGDFDDAPWDEGEDNEVDEVVIYTLNIED